MLKALRISVNEAVLDSASTASSSATEFVVRVATIARYVAKTIKVPIQSRRIPNQLQIDVSTPVRTK